jgi:energy-coupling factor transporter ATP-binding protein EcfA2
VNTGVIIIDGRSASGKSTILRLLAGLESPVEGRLFINGQEIKVGDAPRRDVPSWMQVGPPFISSQSASFHTDSLVQPVIIDGKPDFANSLTVLERIYQIGRDAMQNIFKKQDLVGKDEDDARVRLLQMLALEFAQLLHLTEEQYSCTPSNLSPSGQFLFGMACACMVSVAPSVAALDLNHSTNEHSISIPCPILLFDELFDSEHSSTVEKCKAGITNLINQGGVVISVTHRPSYFMKMASRCITMSGGKVLADIKVQNLENPFEYPKMK